MYAVPHRHDKWVDHRVRVDVTIALGRNLIDAGATVADLSCGDAAIAYGLRKSHGAKLILGDLAPSYEHTGPIEETIDAIPHVDMFICSETIEHLDDPDAVLTAIRGKTDRLLLSTPDNELSAANPNHLWAWDIEAVEDMLRAAGFTPEAFAFTDLRPSGGEYGFQIWGCR